MVIWVAASLVVWTCCLVVLWSVAFDASGPSTLVALAALLLGISVAVLIPGEVVRLSRWVLRRFNLRDKLLALPVAIGFQRSSRNEMKALMRLLGATCIIAAFSGLISTGAIFTVAHLIERLPEVMLFSQSTWTILKFVVQFVAMFPMAMGIAIVFLATGMVRAGSGRDIYASVFRDWCWAIAIGLCFFGICWKLGANLLGLAGVMAVGIIAAGVAIFQRLEVTLRPNRIRQPTETPSRRRVIEIAAAFGALAIGLAGQVRLLGDVVGLSTAGGAVWVAGSIALLTLFLREMDHKSRLPGAKQVIGARIGVFAGLLIQGVLLVLCAAGGLRGVICLIIVIGLQVPNAALAAVVISRQRRLFAQGDRGAGAYVCSILGGVGVAILCYLFVMSLPSGSLILLVSVLGLFAAGVVGGIDFARRLSDQLKWAATGTLLMCALAVAMLGAVYKTTREVGAIHVGAWLSVLGEHPGGGGSAELVGVLPRPPLWRSPRVDEALGEVLASNRGLWCVASVSRQDIPSRVPSGVLVTICPPDPTVRTTGAWADDFVVGSDDGLFAPGRLDQGRYDGVMLTLVPPGNAKAWRCYNERTVQRFLRRRRSGGLSVLRLQVSPGTVGEAMTVAKTFSNAVGSCWVIVDAMDEQADLCLVGPTTLIRRPQVLGNAIVVHTREFWRIFPQVRPLSLLVPRISPRPDPSIKEFIERLRESRQLN
ncbi:MAG: hypothetical protein ACYSTL_04240 [Planctomycetota bacterium]